MPPKRMLRSNFLKTQSVADANEMSGPDLSDSAKRFAYAKPYLEKLGKVISNKGTDYFSNCIKLIENITKRIDEGEDLKSLIDLTEVLKPEKALSILDKDLAIDSVNVPTVLKKRGRPKGAAKTVIGSPRTRARTSSEALQTKDTDLENKVRDPLSSFQNEKLSNVSCSTELYVSSIPDSKLNVRHHIERLKSHLSAEIVNDAMLSLRQQFPKVQGLLSCHMFMDRVPFFNGKLKKSGKLVQILLIDHHYITVSGMYGLKNEASTANLEVYDSLNSYNINKTYLSSQISGILKNTSVLKLHFTLVKVTQQQETDCGIHSIANAYNACSGVCPGLVEYDCGKLRKHLADCIDNKRITKFAERRKVPLTILQKFTMDTVYCVCRQPYTKKQDMVQCDMCKEWFHDECISAKNPYDETTKWLCKYRCIPD